MWKVIRRVMSAGLTVAAVFAILMLVVILAGLGAGYLVNYLLPAINLGSAVIAGVLTFGVALYFVVHIIQLIVKIHLDEQNEDDEDEDIDPEFISDEKLDTMADRVSEAVMMKIGSRGNRRSASSRHRL